MYLKIIPLLIFCLTIFSCRNSNNSTSDSSIVADSLSGKLIVFHAGSMSVPIKKIANGFMQENPKVEVLLESAGSRDCARKISDLNKDCDLMVSADYAVIDEILIPNFAKWNIKFASNEMVIAYNDKSRYINEINSKNWFEILLKKDVAFGRSEPDSDPCGYRSVLVTRLAEDYYKKPGLTKQILKKDRNYIRPKEVDLLSLLEIHTIDYIYIYRSVAEQHGLRYVVLPDSINLKDTAFSEYYKTATVDVSGKKPGERNIIKGEPMVYGITQIAKAPNPIVAEKFIEYFLNAEKGMKIIIEDGQLSVIPSITSSYEFIPDNLKKFAKPDKK